MDLSDFKDVKISDVRLNPPKTPPALGVNSAPPPSLLTVECWLLCCKKRLPFVRV